MTKHKRTPSAKSAPKTVTIAIPKELHTALAEHQKETGMTRKFLLSKYVLAGILKDNDDAAGFEKAQKAKRAAAENED